MPQVLARYQAKLDAIIDYYQQAHQAETLVGKLQLAYFRSTAKKLNDFLQRLEKESEDFVRERTETLSIAGQFTSAAAFSSVLKLRLQTKLIFQNLKAFLRENWALVRGSCLCYTALPEAELTQLLIEIASDIARTESEWQSKQGLMPVSALTVLMPSIVSIESFADDIHHLGAVAVVSAKGREEGKFTEYEEVNLPQIIKTHIVSDDGQSLYPLRLLFKVNLEIEKIKLYNPFFCYEQGNSAELNGAEMDRLFQHSDATRKLYDARLQYFAAKKDKGNLLGQMQLLAENLFFNSVEGMGKEEDAGAGGEAAIVAFFKFFKSLDIRESDLPGDLPLQLMKLRHCTAGGATEKEKKAGIKIKRIETCFQTRRNALLRAMSGHEKKLETFKVNKKKKTALIEECQHEYELTLKHCARAIRDKRYAGRDNLPLSLALLDKFDVMPQFDTKADLALIRHLPSETIGELLQREGVKEKLVATIGDCQDLIMLLLTLSSVQVGILLSYCFKHMYHFRGFFQNKAEIGALFSLLPEDKYKSALAACVPTLRKTIHHHEECFIDLIKVLPTQKKIDVFQSLLDKLVNQDYFAKVFYILVQCSDYDDMARLCSLVSKYWTETFNVQSEHQLVSMISALSNEKRQAFYQALTPYLPQAVEHLSTLIVLVKCLDETSRDELLKRMRDKLPQLVTDASKFKKLMWSMPYAKRKDFYQLFKPQFRQWIKVSDDVVDILTYMPKDEVALFYKASREQILGVIKNNSDFYALYMEFEGEVQFDYFRLALENKKLSINSAREIMPLLAYGDEITRKKLLKMLKEDFTRYVRCIDDYCHITKGLHGREVKRLYGLFKKHQPFTLETVDGILTFMEALDKECLSDWCQQHYQLIKAKTECFHDVIHAFNLMPSSLKRIYALGKKDIIKQGYKIVYGVNYVFDIVNTLDLNVVSQRQFAVHLIQSSIINDEHLRILANNLTRKTVAKLYPDLENMFRRMAASTDCSVMRVLEPLPLDKKSLFLGYIKAQWFKDFHEFVDVYDHLDSKDKKQLLTQCIGHVHEFLDNRPGFITLYGRFDDDGRKALIESLGQSGHLIEIYPRLSNYINATIYINQSNSALIFQFISKSLLEDVVDLSELVELMQCLNNAQRAQVFAQFKEIICLMFKENNVPPGVLAAFKAEELDIIIQSIGHQFVKHISTFEALKRYIKTLSAESQIKLIDEHMASFNKLVQNNQQRLILINYMNPAQLDRWALSTRFFERCDSFDACLAVLSIFPKPLQNKYVEIINAKEILGQSGADWETLDEFYPLLLKFDEELRLSLIKSIGDVWFSLLKSGFETLNEMFLQEKDLIFDLIKDKLTPETLKKEQFWVFLEIFQHHQCFLWQAFKNDIDVLISNINELRQALESIMPRDRLTFCRQHKAMIIKLLNPNDKMINLLRQLLPAVFQNEMASELLTQGLTDKLDFFANVETFRVLDSVNREQLYPHLIQIIPSHINRPQKLAAWLEILESAESDALIKVMHEKISSWLTAKMTAFKAIYHLPYQAIHVLYHRHREEILYDIDNLTFLYEVLKLENKASHKALLAQYQPHCHQLIESASDIQPLFELYGDKVALSVLDSIDLWQIIKNVYDLRKLMLLVPKEKQQHYLSKLFMQFQRELAQPYSFSLVYQALNPYYQTIIWQVHCKIIRDNIHCVDDFLSIMNVLNEVDAIALYHSVKDKLDFAGIKSILDVQYLLKCLPKSLSSELYQQHQPSWLELVDDCQDFNRLCQCLDKTKIMPLFHQYQHKLDASMRSMNDLCRVIEVLPIDKRTAFFKKNVERFDMNEIDKYLLITLIEVLDLEGQQAVMKLLDENKLAKRLTTNLNMLLLSALKPPLSHHWYSLIVDTLKININTFYQLGSLIHRLHDESKAQALNDLKFLIYRLTNTCDDYLILVGEIGLSHASTIYDLFKDVLPDMIYSVSALVQVMRPLDKASRNQLLMTMKGSLAKWQNSPREWKALLSLVDDKQRAVLRPIYYGQDQSVLASFLGDGSRCKDARPFCTLALDMDGIACRV